MNRRGFVGAIAGLSVATVFTNGAAAAPLREQPKHTAIGDEFVLYDYCFGRSFGDRDGSPWMLIEIQNVSDMAWELPTMLATFIDDDGNIVGESDVFPQIPYVDSKANSIAASYFYRGFNPLTDEWSRVTVTSRSAPRAIEDSLWNKMSIKDTEQELGRDYYSIQGNVLNERGEEVKDITVYAVFKNRDGRLAGYDKDTIESSIPNLKKARFRIEASDGANVQTFSPYQNIVGSYSVELSVTTS